MRTKDVTVKDLEDLVLLIRKTWVGENLARLDTVRCGTLHVDHVEGLAELVIRLRFPLSLAWR
jgi:hypothetical protein